MIPLLSCVVLFCTACCGRSGGASAAAGEAVAAAGCGDTVRIEPRYATGFDVAYCDGYELLTLHDPQSETAAVSRFALVPRGTAPRIPEGCTPIEVPVRSVICMTSLQLSNFIALDRLDVVAGIASARHLRNAKMRERLADGRTRKIGIEGNFDSETIMGIDPDIILISPYKRGGYDAMREVGTPLVPHFGYKETTPLGQAEWIKCVGLLLGCAAEADSLFEAIAGRYDALCARARTVAKRPVVFSGELRNGNWYAVGGRSFLAQLFRDAGADYFLKDDMRSGGVTLDFERVYEQAAEADYWRILNSYEGDFSYEVLRGEDPRYADFRAWRERGIVYCNLREVPFYENTPAEPDVVLADLIKAFHPDLLPDHEPVYYRLLR